jgi:hypothetical protein
MIVMFRESHSKALLIAGRAALLGFATLLVSMTSAIGQEAPDREDSRRDSDEDRREVVDLADVEYTAGPRHKGESDRDRPEHRAARREEGRKGPKDEDESRERAHAEMRHAQQALIRAAHRIVELDERASAHHEGPRGPKPGDRAMEGRRGPGREDGRGERHAEEGRGPKHEGERAERRGEGRGEHREAGMRGEHRGPKGEKPAPHLVKGGPKEGHREMDIDKKHEGRAETPKAHPDADARINHIEKKLDELIKIVHEMKAHEAKEGKEKSKK